MTDSPRDVIAGNIKVGDKLVITATVDTVYRQRDSEGNLCVRLSSGRRYWWVAADKELEVRV